MTNSLFVISPYKEDGVWVFDDGSRGLVKEPFVSGIPSIIEKATERLNEPEKGFVVLFSAGPFPEYMYKLDKDIPEYDGTWYELKEFNMRGWLCPALLKYFEEPPEEIYIAVKNKE